MTRLAFTQAELRDRILVAEDAGRAISEIKFTRDGNVELITTEGQLHRPPRLFDRERAAAYCRMTPDTFVMFVKAGVLPPASRATKRWDRKSLEAPLARLDVKPTRIGLKVYFIECGKFIKIGFSGSAITRMRDLQSATPYELKLLGAIPARRRR